MSPPDRLVRFQVDDGVAVVTLADPDHRNALSWAVSHELADAVAAVLDRDARAIVVTAEPPVFCAGGSLPDLLDPKGPLRETYAGFLAVAHAPVPTIAAVNGPCIGAGVNLPLACDVVLCSPEARFDPRFLDIAIAPGGGHFWRLARRVGRQGAAAMTLCGDTLDGRAAERAGLAWRCVQGDELLPTALQLATTAAARPPELVRRAKAMLQQSVGAAAVDEAFEQELALQEWSMQQPEFAERVETMRARTSSRSSPAGSSSGQDARPNGAGAR